MAIEIPSILNSITPTNSFKDMLLNKANDLNKCYTHFNVKEPRTLSEEDEESIHLSDEEKHQIYRPWRFSVIIKLTNKCLAHNYLRIKLIDLWKLTEPLILIDFDCDYYIAKFNKPKNSTKALHGVLGS